MYKLNLSVPKTNQVCYGEKGWDIMGLKSEKYIADLKTFKDIIKNWNGSTCNCEVCQSWPELILS